MFHAPKNNGETINPNVPECSVNSTSPICGGIILRFVSRACQIVHKPPKYCGNPKEKQENSTLVRIQVIRRAQYEAFDVDTKMEGVRALIPGGPMHVHLLLEAEVYTLVGACYEMVNERDDDFCQDFRTAKI